MQLRVILPQAGYATAYVATESDADVFFDDITVEHRQGLQVQHAEYDPYGLELAGLSTSSPGLKQLSQYTWNGKELQTDFGLGWSDHGWRMYDRQLGRWPVVDPDAEEGDQEGWTTYQFGLNNAVRYNDLDGRCPICPVLPWVAPVVYEAAVAAVAVAATYFAATAVVQTVEAVRQAPPAGGTTVVAPPRSSGGMTAGRVEGRAQPGGMTAAPAGQRGTRPGPTATTVPGKAENGRVEARRGKNHLTPDPAATGPHSRLDVDQNGTWTKKKYAEYAPNPNRPANPRTGNPGGYDEVKRVDLDPNSAPHVDTRTGQPVPAPHVNDPKAPGGVRPTRPDELPRP